MRALDTNVLVRFLVNDDAEQAAAAKNLLRRVEAAGDQLLVVTPVVLELIWVLEAVYDCKRAEILDALDNLTNLAALRFEHPERIRKLVVLGRSTPQELSDLLIGICGHDAGHQKTLTFDVDASKSALFERLIA